MELQGKAKCVCIFKIFKIILTMMLITAIIWLYSFYLIISYTVPRQFVLVFFVLASRDTYLDWFAFILVFLFIIELRVLKIWSELKTNDSGAGPLLASNLKNGYTCRTPGCLSDAITSGPNNEGKVKVTQGHIFVCLFLASCLSSLNLG